MPNPPFPTTLRTHDGLDLRTHCWPAPTDPEGARVQGSPGVALIVHGLGEHAQRYAHVAACLNARGWQVVAYDHRGHGHSPGQRGVLQHDDDLLRDLAAAVDATRLAYPGLRLVLIGHSLGGALAGRFVAALAQPAESRQTAPWARPVDGLVLSSPALAIALNPVQKALLATVGRWLPDLAVGNGLRPEWVCHNPATVAAYRADPLVHDRISGRLSHFLLSAGEAVRARAATWSTPTLLLWGGQDRCVSPAGSEAFARAAPPALVSAQAFPALAHEIFNETERDAVLQHMLDWLGRVFGR